MGYSLYEHIEYMVPTKMYKFLIQLFWKMLFYLPPTSQLMGQREQIKED